jgi:hypothetical protein
MSFCHSCGTQLAETGKFCPSCGAAYQGSQSQTQQPVQAAAISAPLQTKQSFQNTQPIPVQQNVVIIGKAKSVGVAFLLAFLFGPLGLLYATIIGGIVMFVVSLLLSIALPIVGTVLSWIGCIIWACVAADQANKNLQKQGNALIR